MFPDFNDAHPDSDLMDVLSLSFAYFPGIQPHAKYTLLEMLSLGMKTRLAMLKIKTNFFF